MTDESNTRPTPAERHGAPPSSEIDEFGQTAAEVFSPEVMSALLLDDGPDAPDFDLVGRLKRNHPTAEVPSALDKISAQLAMPRPRADPIALERARCISICEGWIGTFQDIEIKFTSAREYAVDAIEDIIELIRDGQPTDTERPVPQVREARDPDLAGFLRTEAKARRTNDDGIWGLLEEAADAIDALALTARPSDAAAAWPSRDAIAKIIEDNIYRKPNGNWDGDFQDLLVAADEIRALPPDEPARELAERRRASMERQVRAHSDATEDEPARVSGDCGEFMPLTLKPLDDPNHDPGEHWVLDAETAYIFKLCCMRDRAERIVAALNRLSPTIATRSTGGEAAVDVIRKLVSLFDDQGNMIADFSTMQTAVLNGYDFLSRYAQEKT